MFGKPKIAKCSFTRVLAIVSDVVFDKAKARACFEYSQITLRMNLRDSLVTGSGPTMSIAILLKQEDG